MKVLVACEFSGTVRDALLRNGHDAISCDLLPTTSPGPHVQGDVTPLLSRSWDLVIAHPPCTYLANSGVGWLGTQPGRYENMLAAAAFFRKCLDANAPKVAVENPIMHKYAKRAAQIGNPDCIIQPYQFGHPETKATCFWLRGLPPLYPTLAVEGRVPRVYHEPPHPDRWKRRSITYTGIADAIAEQWGECSW